MANEKATTFRTSGPLKTAAEAVEILLGA